MALDGDLVDRALMEIPPAWIKGDELHLQRLLGRLFARRVLVPQLVADAVDWLQQQRQCR